jgi:hypothetical protein
MEQWNFYHYSKHTKIRDTRFQNFVSNNAAHSQGRLPLMMCVCVCVRACGRVYVSLKVPTGNRNPTLSSKLRIQSSCTNSRLTSLHQNIQIYRSRSAYKQQEPYN